MAILDGGDSAASGTTPRPRRRARRPSKRGLFLTTLIPRGAVTASVSCSLLAFCPSEFEPRASGRTATHAARQLVVAHGSTLTLHTTDASTGGLRELASLTTASPVRDLRVMPASSPGMDVVVALTGRNRVLFVSYEPVQGRMKVVGSVRLRTIGSAVDESRLLATHAHRKICAVCALSSTVAVFPVHFLNTAASIGKTARVAVDGVILACDFLEDDDGLPSDAVLLVLVQRGTEQWIAVYSVGTDPGASASAAGLSLTHLGSMITCAERPDDAVAKRFGARLRPPSAAVGLARIPRAPYLFAVFLEDRVVAADARPVVVGALEARDALPVSMRVRPDRGGPTQPPAHWGARASMNSHAGSDEHTPAPAPAPPAPGEIFDPEPHHHHQPHPPPPPLPARPHAGIPRPPPPLPPVRGQPRADAFMSYLYVPSCVSLDLGSSEGAAVSWTSARDHFCASPEAADDEDGMYISMESGALFALRWSTTPRTNSLVIPAEERTRTGPRRSFCVEYAGHVGSASAMAAMDGNLLYVGVEGGDGSLRHVEPPRGSSPTDGRWDAESGTAAVKETAPPPPPPLPTDARWAERARVDPESVLAASSVADVGYGLDVRQEFLNLSPISDFVVVPPGGVEPPHPPSAPAFGGSRDGRSADSSPASLPRRGAKRGRAALSLSLSSASSKGGANGGRESLRHSASAPASGSSGAGNTPVGAIHLGDDDDDADAGGRGERTPAEIVVACGLGRSGTVRIVRPGAPVTVFSSSEDVFQGCNDMWSVRLSARARHDSMIVLSFTQSTRVLFSVPSSVVSPGGGGGEGGANPNTISHLLDATRTTRIIGETRSHVVGRLDDGLLAQVHASGVRTMLFLKKSEMKSPLVTSDGEITSPLVKHYWDWAVPDGHSISRAAIGAKMIFVSVVRTQDRCPCLIILRQRSLDEMAGGLSEVSTLELNDELSCISVAEWPTMYYEEVDSGSVAAEANEAPTMVILGTYAPSLEVWMLSANLTMECVGISKIGPWGTVSAAGILKEQIIDEEDKEDQISRPGGPGVSKAASPKLNGKRADTHWLNAFSNPTPSSPTPERNLSASIMTGVPESIAAFEINSQQWIFVGLRNGTVLRYCLGDDEADGDVELVTPRAEQGLRLVSRTRIGDVPITLTRVVATSGHAIIAQAERPWVASAERAEGEWMPMAFGETRAWCGYSVQGGERCLAAVCANDRMHVCGLRRLTPVSVGGTILVGDTPRRVLPMPEETVLVATCREPKDEATAPDDGGERYPMSEESGVGDSETTTPLPYSELKLFHKGSKRMLCKARLKPDELVHVLLRWGAFVVVGTSVQLRSGRTPGGVPGCRRGRLLLYAVTQTSGDADADASIELVSEIVMSGAVLAGAIGTQEDMLVVSANERMLVFGKLAHAIFEVARVELRRTVVSIDVRGPTICVADAKDSVAFLRINWRTGGLVHDRTDGCSRVVADAVMVDARRALVVDKFGGICTLGYREGEREEAGGYQAPAEGVVGLLPEGVRVRLREAERGRTHPHHPPRWADAFREIEMGEEGAGSGGDAGSGAGVSVESNDGTSENAGNSAMNDVLYEGSVEADEVEDVEDVDDVEDVEDDDGVPGVGADAMDEVVAVDDAADAPNVDGMQDDDDDEDDEDADADMPPFFNFAPPGDLAPARGTRRGHTSSLWTLEAAHSSRLPDAALRVRTGVFRRPEAIAADGGGGGRDFWREGDRAVFAGTLGGAVVVGVPVCADTVRLLGDLAEAMEGEAHERGDNVVDGDRMRAFLGLGDEGKREVVRRAGFSGKGAVLRVVGVVEEVLRRVG